METDAGSFGDDTATETLIEAVYERTAVALRVDGAEVGGFPPGAGSELRSAACSGDAPAQAFGVVFRDQLSSGFPCGAELRVPDLVVEIFEGQLLRLDLEVDAIRARGLQARSNPSRMFSISSAATP